MKVIALDFDGVIADSAGGWAFFCRKAWENLGFNNVPSVSLIKNHRPFISTAKDNYGLLLLLSKNQKVSRAAVKQIAKKHPEEAQKMADAFFSEKETFIKEDKDKFCDLYGPFKFIVPLLQELSKKENIYVVTSNRKSQVIDVLRRNKIDVKEQNILDSSISKNKSELINMVADREKIKATDILFIDDSLEHLKEVVPTGVQAALASWGFVLEEDLNEARKLGIMILDKKNIRSVLSANVEFFDVIDKDNKVTGKAPRDECHRRGLLHRAVHIMILNSKCEFLLQKRSKKKDLYSGWWTSSASGHVASGDGYDETAHRELKEEIGIDAKLGKIFVVIKDYKGEGKCDRERIMFYVARHEGPFKINKDEIDSVKFFPPGKIREMMQKEKFTPGTVAVFRELRKRPELLKRLGLS